MPSQNHNSFISLFSGAGGLDIGLEQAGFVTVSATDLDADSIATLHLNKLRGIVIEGRPESKYLEYAKIVEKDILFLTRDDLIPPGVSRDWRPDLLAGGPPCQPFSSSGKQQSVLDQRGRLFEEFVRIAEELHPNVILFENVRGLVTARGPSGTPGEALNLVRESFENIGYATRFFLLNSADYGSPQRRVRLFMVGTCKHNLPLPPQPSHSKSPQPELFGELKPWMTLGEFLQTMPAPDPNEIVRPSAKLKQKLNILSPGQGLKSPGRKEATRPGGHWGYKQGTFIANPELPARTITAASTQDWIRDNDGTLRRLTLRECASLQGFPTDWEFYGSRTSCFRQIGNAVPAIFGKVIGLEIVKALNTPVSSRPLRSDLLPDYMQSAIEYTRKDHERNAKSRSRAKVFLKDCLGDA